MPRRIAQGLLAKKPFKVVQLISDCALANKTARIVWALLARGGVYRTDVAAEPAHGPRAAPAPD